MNMIRTFAVAMALLGALASTGYAETIILPTDPSWFAFGNSGGGSSAITTTQPRSGDGSVEMFGDRTRFGTFSSGDPFASGASPGMGLLNNVTSLSFDWQIAVGSTNPYHPDYTPALRLHVWDPSAANPRSELIWEGAYNGVYGNAVEGTWYTSGATDRFWRFVAGLGETNDPGLVTQSIANWASGQSSGGVQWYSDNAFVYGISVGAGSGASSNYHAFADNVVFDLTTGEPTVFNFEVSAAAAEVPEPASLAVWSLLAAGGAVMGWRRKRR
jgi:hypothetical protein